MGFKDKMVRSATKFGQGIVDTGHRAFNAVTENRRNALQVDLPSQRPSAYEAEELLENTYTLPALSQQMQQRSEQTKTQQDTLIEKVENVAFRHHYYRARDNYEPSFSLCNPDSERFAIKRDPYMQSVRGIMLRRFVITNEELQTEKMNNIFSSMASLGSTLALVIHRNPEDCTVSFLTSTTRSDVDESGFGLEDRADQTLETLDNVLRGNFPGTQTCRIGANREPNTFAELKELFSNAEERPEDSVQGWMRLYRLKGDDAFTKDGDAFPYNVGDLMDEVFYRDNRKAIAAVTGVPSLKSSDSKFITQGIEKLIDGIVPQDESESYTLMLLAAPLSPQQVALVRNGYEQMASQLSPLKEFQFTVTASQSNSASATMTEALNRQISEATTLAAGVGAHAGVSANASCSTGFSEGTNDSRSTGENWSKGTNGSHSESHLGVKKKAPVIHTKSDTKGWSKSKGGSTTETSGSSTTENFGAQASAGANAGISAHLDMTENLSGGRSYCWNSAATKSLESSLSQGETRTYTSEPVKRVLERLHQEIQRLEASESSGMWRFAGYAIAGSFAMAQRVASVYQGMIQGEGSEVERSSVNIWTERDKGFNAIITSLLNFEHPQFRCTKENSTLPADMYCATELTSAELALAMALPQKAVPGLPVVTCASFGRSVQTMDDEQIIPSDSLQLGHLYHMMQDEPNIPVELDKLSLTGHTFITGSTGSGKSNAIYKLLLAAKEEEIPFLVIEPAKGEYKDALGSMDGVRVLGTNYKFAPLLRLNPFSFPATVHVLEHIDRIIEIFNACWPMYAAMPAILKDTFVRSYANAGWDTQLSECQYDPPRYPTFRDILELLPKVIKESAYSADTTSDYVGALVTRVRSLTTGLNDLIFTDDELDFSKLFHQSIIIDLSRIASTETKSLIMGLLIIKLQEYRMHEAEMGRSGNTPFAVRNQTLRHFTVLEEAHHLLRYASPVQSQESANLQGKSVELIANSIAEMRTYGEGFIIADQAPGLLDPVVIRNTNTKIILRLPDAEDRELVGRAAALTEEQRDELAKLPRGVAAVYQSNWLEAVLCKIDYAEVGSAQPFKFEEKPVLPLAPREVIARLVLDTAAYDLTDDEWLRISEWGEKNVSEATYDLIRRLREKEQLLPVEKRQILYDVFDGKSLGLRIRNLLQGDCADSTALQLIARYLPLHECPERDKIALHIFDEIFPQYCEFLRQSGEAGTKRAIVSESIEFLQMKYAALRGVK